MDIKIAFFKEEAKKKKNCERARFTKWAIFSAIEEKSVFLYTVIYM
jgi:hypothetical protein